MPSMFILESKASAVIDDDLEAFILELQREDLSGERVPKYRRQTLPEKYTRAKILLHAKYENNHLVTQQKNCFQIAIGPEIQHKYSTKSVTAEKMINAPSKENASHQT